MSIKDMKRKYGQEIKEAINDLKTKGKRKKQIPNLLTASRLFAPIFIIPAAAFGNLPLAGILTMGFAATDGVDGFLARRWKVTSELGRDLDAVTDKIFAGTLLITLSFFNPTLITTLGLEAVIGGVNAYSAYKGNDPRTAIVGKVKTAALSALIVSSFAGAFFNVPSVVTNGLFAATTALQVITAGKYVKTHLDKEKAKKVVNELRVTPVTPVPQTNDSLSKQKEKQFTNNGNGKNNSKSEKDAYKAFRDVLAHEVEISKVQTEEVKKEEEKGFSKSLRR